MNPSSISRYQALMIDLDGTMVDTMGDFVAVLDVCLQEMGLPLLPESTVRRLVGKGSEHLIRSVMAMVVPDWSRLPAAAQATQYARAWSLYQHHYLLLNGQHSAVYPGVLKGLQGLQRLGLPLACLTNKPTAFAMPLLASKGLAGFFSVVFGGDAFEHKKPHPMPLLKTCEALGTPPSLTLMVGDSSNDAQAARAAGCPVALVTYGYNHGEPIENAPHDKLISSLADLLN